MKRRLRLGIVAGVYWMHGTLALGLAWPVARVVGIPTLTHPRGDAVLFDEGAMYLTEVLRLHRSVLAHLAEGMSFLVLMAIYLGLFPLGMMLHALAKPEARKLSALAAAASRSFGPMSLLMGLALVATALAAVLPLGIASLLETKLRATLGDRGADIAEFGWRLLALSLAALIAIVHDLARAAVTTREMSGLAAVELALASFRAHPLPAVVAFGLRGLLGVLLVLGGAVATMRLGVEADLHFAAVLLLHQAIAFMLIVLRADWLTLAMALLIEDT